ncbi:MAG: VacJ family lipoprotein [Xanthomonadales bacterium]
MIRCDRVNLHPLWSRASTVLLVILLGACASQPTTMTDPERDPWESYNRKIYAFNMSLDKTLFRPVAKGYDFVMPGAPQRGVRNFFHNLAYPVTFLNLLLQGRFEDSLTATGRFLVNSTVGLLGFFDVASKEGIADYNEDFGQTMAVWGWKHSRYLVMPIVGPLTPRDLLGRGFYSYTYPVSVYARKHGNYLPLAVDLITLRASLLTFDDDIRNAHDPYALIRDAYLQRREFLIYDGEPPAPDYDALLEE